MALAKIDPWPRRGRTAPVAAMLTVLALTLAACGGTPEGEQLVERGSLLPKPPAPTLEQMRTFRDREEWTAVAAAGTRFLEENPGHPEVLLMVGDAQLKLGRPGEAIGHFAAVQQTGRFTAEAQQGQGLSLLALGQAGQAMEPLERAIAADSSLWRAWNGLGIAHDRREEWAEASAAYRKAQELQPASAAIANNLGISLIMQERYEDAVEALTAAVRLDRSNAQARSNLRFAYALQGRYLEAMAGVTREELPDVLNNVGYAAMLKADFDAAEAYLTRALEVSPRHHAEAERNLDLLRLRREAEAMAAQS